MAPSVCATSVEHDVERLFPGNGLRQAPRDPLREGKDALVGRRAEPAQRQRHLGLAFGQIEGGEMAADGGRKLFGIDDLVANIGRLHHLEIAPRQQRAGIGDGAGVSGKLNAVFRGAERGGADALAGRQ